MIDRETQQKIKDAANIVEVVGDYVKLTRRGANYMGLCPFHNERTPSFSVSPQRNFCHCFSCKKGGSPVNFLMEKEGISYTEALMLLAKKYNIPVQERELTPEEKARMSEREAMIIASEWAMNAFHYNLYNTDEGREIGLSYLYGRGITDEAIRKYKLGYSIDRGDALISKARNEGFDIEVFKKIGLVGTSQHGRDYDKFRGRVMFPIRNTSGKPVAFGGRALKGEAAKYINSAETPLYKKSNELYGIFEAKGEIIKDNRVFLMEGYLDVIGSWQAGLKNVVASSGTALTENQISLIHRFTNNVTLIYDGDSAGIKAALRGIDMLLSQKLHVSMLLLPDGEDPDSFARKHTPEEFREYIDAHQTDFIRFKIGALLKNANGNPQKIAEATRSVVNSIACIPDEIERISYIKECSRLLDIDDKVITKQVRIAMLSRRQEETPRQPRVAVAENDTPQHPGAPTPSKPEETPQPQQPTRYLRQEEVLLKYCVRYGFMPFYLDEDQQTHVIKYVEEEMEADQIKFSNPSFKKIFQLLLERMDGFATEFEKFKVRVEEILESERNAFFDKLRNQGGSMAKLEAEENRYFKMEEQRREDLLKKFATDFSVDYLINHEDNEVRNVANTLVAERHTLSEIYTKDGNTVVGEEDRLQDLVPRALSELRSEMLNSRVQELKRKIAEANRNNDKEAQEKYMAEFTKILFIRSRIAEGLGERIISPR